MLKDFDMPSDIVPEAVFLDDQLSDDTATRRKLPELQGSDPIRKTNGNAECNQ